MFNLGERQAELNKDSNVDGVTRDLFFRQSQLQLPRVAPVQCREEVTGTHFRETLA
jgi:hypothetical protein